MKIKIFVSTVSDSDLENKIDEWSRGLNPEIISVSVNIVRMVDYYQNTAPPMICNQWQEYTAAIVYNIKQLES